MKDKKYATVEWTAQDVIENAGQFNIDITEDDALGLLMHRECYIVDAMVEAGWRIIEDALQKSNSIK